MKYQNFFTLMIRIAYSTGNSFIRFILKRSEHVLSLIKLLKITKYIIFETETVTETHQRCYLFEFNRQFLSKLHFNEKQVMRQ